MTDPPTDEDRLELYSSLARRYERSTRALRAEDSNPGIVNAALVDGRLVRAALLRKFYLGADDQVHLDRVAAALGRHALSTGKEAVVEATCRLVHEDFQPKQGDGDDTAPSLLIMADEVFRLVVYGNVLHADYGKWRKSSTSYLGPAFSVSLSKTVHRLERLLLDLLAAVDEVLGEGRGRIRSKAGGTEPSTGT